MNHHRRVTIDLDFVSVFFESVALIVMFSFLNEGRGKYTLVFKYTLCCDKFCCFFDFV